MGGLGRVSLTFWSSKGCVLQKASSRGSSCFVILRSIKKMIGLDPWIGLDSCAVLEGKVQLNLVSRL